MDLCNKMDNTNKKLQLPVSFSAPSQNNQTDPMFSKFDQVLGKANPTTNHSPIQTRADEVLALEKNGADQSQSIKPNPSFTGMPKTGMGDTPAIADKNTPSTVDMVKNTAKSVVSGTIESGKDIAAAIGAPQLQTKLDAISEGDRKYLGTVIQLRNKAATNNDPKLVEHYQNLVKNYKMTDGGKVSDVFPEINKSTEQIIGDFASMGLELTGGGSLASAGAEKVAQMGEKGGLSLGQRFIQGSLNGGKYGTMFGVTGAMQNNASPEDIAKSGAVGGITGAILGAGTEGIFGKRVTQGVANQEAKTVNETIGRIIQGQEKDIPAAISSLSSIDTSGVKTYKDLFTKLNDRVEALSGSQDTHLNVTNKEAIPMDKLVVTTKVGDQEITHNFINDALTQLGTFYEKTNDVAGKAEIDQLTKKASEGGLSLKDVNDVARLHGIELNAYNANGELASGLTKQAAENTRAGLKATVRQLAGDEGGKASEAIDKSISNTIKTRDLVGEIADKVTELQQKIKPRTLGEQAGRLFGKITNLIGLNTPKGFIEYFLGRGTGLKTLNAIDLQEGLQKGLKSIQDLIDSSGSEETLIKKMQFFLKELGGKMNEEVNMKDIPNKEGGFIKVPFSSAKPSSGEVGTLRDFTDYVSGNYKISGKDLTQLKQDVQDIAQKYKIKNFSGGDKALANGIRQFLKKS